MIDLGCKRLRAALASAMFGLLPILTNGPALAQTPAAAGGSVSGTVTTGDGAPVRGASITLAGPAKETTSTGAGGTFAFANVPAGTYVLTVAKAGFTELTQDGVAITAGLTTSLNVTLVASSFSSLREIGRVSANQPGRVSINTGPASTSVISNQLFTDQGLQQVTSALDQTPGIVASRTEGGNSADQANEVVPQIRGALPYETETLVDGHPVSVGSEGYFPVNYINPALLQDIEISKGPGVLGTDINYAIGGSINYRTLEPTRTFHAAADFSIDGFSGTQSAVRITGSTPTHLVDYAFGYALDGTPGPLNNYQVAGSQLPLLYGGAALNPDGTGPWYVNGRGYAGIPEGLAPSTTPQYAGVPGEANFAQPIYVCCSSVNTQFFDRSELAKLRFNLSTQTALTVSYLGAQSFNNQTGVQASSLSPLGTNGNFSTFAPPAGYTGSVAAGTPIPFDLVANLPLYNSIQQSLAQAELRSAVGNATLLARYYIGDDNSLQYDYLQPTNERFTEAAWGGAALCAQGVAFSFVTGTCANGVAPTMAYFNGQPTTFTSGNAQISDSRADHLRGYSIEGDLPFSSRDVLTVSLDQSHHDSVFYENAPVDEVVGYQVAPGSSQQFTTELARLQLGVAPRVNAFVSNYLIQYASHYTGDGGATFSNSTHGFDAPRLALSWRPNSDVAWRFALGSSIAPPYIDLLSAPAQVPQPNSVPATYYTLNKNNGNLRPETAFGYDLGLDKRIVRSVSLSADAYLTNLNNSFLPATFQAGTYSSAASSNTAEPLYITQTQNLGFARYEGLELAINDAPLSGFGFTLEGSLERGYPYDLPSNFYNTAAGKYTANLGVIPNVNFQPSGLGYSAFFARVPYSSGSTAVNYRTLRGVYADLGIRYFGPNNSFDEPAFGVVYADLRVPVSQGITLQFNGDNLTGAYDKGYFGYFSGVAVPLVNGGHTSAGYLGTTSGGQYGPATFRATLKYTFGK